MKRLFSLAFLIFLPSCLSRNLSENMLGADKKSSKQDLQKRSDLSLPLHIDVSALHLTPGQACTVSFHASAPTSMCSGQGQFTYNSEPIVDVNLAFDSAISACDASGYFRIANERVIGATVQSYNLKKSAPASISMLPVTTFRFSLPNLKYDLKSNASFYITCAGAKCSVMSLLSLDFNSDAYVAAKNEFRYSMDNFLSPNDTYLIKAALRTEDGLVLLNGKTDPTSDGYTVLLSEEKSQEVIAILPKGIDAQPMISLSIFENKKQIALLQIPANKFPLKLHLPNKSFCLSGYASANIGAFFVDPKSTDDKQPISKNFDPAITCYSI